MTIAMLVITILAVLSVIAGAVCGVIVDDIFFILGLGVAGGLMTLASLVMLVGELVKAVSV